jgi:hypothetical protein
MVQCYPLALVVEKVTIILICDCRYATLRFEEIKYVNRSGTLLSKNLTKNK